MNNKKYYLAIFFNHKIISVHACSSEQERELLIHENQIFGYQIEKGFIHFNQLTNKLVWRNKGHSRRSRSVIKHEFDKSLIKRY